MKNYRFISLILAAVLLGGALVSCARPEEPIVIRRNGYTLSESFSGSSPIGAGLPDELCSVTVTAKDSHGRTVPVNTEFSLSFANATNKETLSEYLTLSPETEYDILEHSSTEYTVKPKTELLSSSVYKLTLGDNGKEQISFAFQTESRFALFSSIPADLAVNVPVNSGIEFDFTSALSASFTLSDHVSISPSVKYRAELYPNGKRIAIIPEEKLKENTEYTVKISKDIPSASGDKLEEDIVIRFRTAAKTVNLGESQKYYLNLNPSSLTAKTGEGAYFLFNFNPYRTNAQIKDVKADIYRFKNADELISATKAFNEKGAELISSGKAYTYSTEKLSRVLTDSLQVHADGSRHYAYLPALERGIYIADITVEIKINGKIESHTVQQIIQVSDITAYSEYYNKNALIWAHKNGNALAGADITAELFCREQNFSLENKPENYTAVKVQTNKDGTARFTVPEKDNSAIVKISDGEDTLILFLSALDSTYSPASFSHIYTDREVYFSDDRVNFSGIIAHKSGVTEEKLWLQVNYNGTKYPINVNADGSFEGFYIIEDFIGYGITLRVLNDDGVCLASKFVRVTQQEKPVYTATLTLDKLFYEKGDTARFTVHASFFDGTPAQNIKFYITASVSGHSTVYHVTTDESGNAHGEYRLPAVNTGSTYPSQLFVSATLEGTETSSLYVSTGTRYFHSDFYFEHKTEYGEDGKARSLVTLNEVDTSALHTESDLYYPHFPQNTVGKALDGVAKVTLTKVTYTKHKTGTSYDPINKVTYDNYTTTRSESVVKTSNESIVNGKLYLENIESDGSFNGYYYYTASYGGYKLTFNATTRDVTVYGRDYRELVLEKDKEAYDVGDIIKYSVREYPEETNTARSYLVSVLSESGTEHFVTSSPDFEIEFKAEYVTGVAVNVTALDNGAYTLLSDAPVFDFESSNSYTLEIKTDKTEYQPGEKVNVTVTVKDKNGSPAKSGTLITLSVADEACFALGDQTVNVLEALYSSGTRIPRSARNNYYSLFYAYSYPYYYFYKELTTEADSALNAAPGEAMDDTSESTDGVRVRKDFADNPVYELITSENGTASFTFTAPDNITSWRITALAVNISEAENGQVLAGNSASNIIATLPFFINAGTLSTYVEGDDITASARVNGKNAEGIFTATGEVFDESGKLIKTVTAQTESGNICFISFGRLTCGEYVLRITCKTDKAADAVEYPFSVVKSALLAETERIISVDEIGSLEVAKYPLSLSFVNAAQREMLTLAQGLMYTNSSRADSIAASITAKNLISSFFGGANDTSKLKEILNSDHRNAGLISLLPYSSGELKLSALVAALSTDALTGGTKDMLRESFISRLNGKCTEEELVYSLLGLAALGEPVLADLELVASGSESFSLEGKLILSAAFAIIGDHSAARTIYNDLKAEHFALSGDKSEAYFAAKGMSTEEKLSLTASALISASLIEREDAALMVRYMLERTSELEYYGLYTAFYLSNLIATDNSESTLVYSIGGEKHTAAIKAGRYYTLTLTKADYESLEITVADGLCVMARYTTAAQNAARDAAPSDELKIDKSITSMGDGIYLVTVSYTVRTDKDYVSYRISDVIPSGARFYKYHSNNTHSKNSYLYLSNTAQNMEGYLSCYREKTLGLFGIGEKTYSGSFSYMIRTAIKGEYIVEAALAQNTETGSYALSERSKITLK
ncbi:MAG: Ig-like domain-containing protein [Clostridia bacterium]|nr:Ig-like domain-containing protein [Clostridia bacterium]